MVVSTSGRHEVSPHQLARWGLWHQVQREECIDNLIDEIQQPDTEQFKALQEQWLQAHELPNQRALQGWLHQQDLDQADWTELITRPWRWQQWCHGHFKDQLSTYYLKRKPLLDRVSYSLLRVKDKALATELYLRIKEGEATFEQVASEYSAGPERNSGGQLGPVAMQQPHPVLIPDGEILAGSVWDDSLIGSDTNDVLIGSITGASEEQWDVLTGGGGGDLFVLGNKNGSFYSSGGMADYAQITDFDPTQDQLQLHGGSNYAMAQVNHPDVIGTGIFNDLNSDGLVGEGDDLIAVIANQDQPVEIQRENLKFV